MANVRIGFHSANKTLEGTFERLARGLHVKRAHVAQLRTTHDLENEIKRQFPDANFFVPSFVGTPFQIFVGSKVACAVHAHLRKPMAVVVDPLGYEALKESGLPAASIRTVIGIGLLRPLDAVSFIHRNAKWLKVGSCRWTEHELDGAATYLYGATRPFDWGLT